MAYVQKLCTRLGLNSRAVASSPWCSNLATPTKSRTVFTGRFLPIENTKQKTSLGDNLQNFFSSSLTLRAFTILQQFSNNLNNL
jgi:hypothetical protein